MLYMPEDISTGYKTNWQGKNFANRARDIMRTYGSGNVFQGIGEAFSTLAGVVDRGPAHCNGRKSTRVNTKRYW